MPKCIPSPAVKIRHRISCKSIPRFSITELVKYCGSPTYTLNKKVIGEQGPQDTLQTSSASTPARIFFLALMSCCCFAASLARPFTPHKASATVCDLPSPVQRQDLEFKTLCGGKTSFAQAENVFGK